MAQRFEAEAQANYEWYMNRSEEEKKADEAILEKKFAELYSMLSKAHLGRIWVFWKTLLAFSVNEPKELESFKCGDLDIDEFFAKDCFGFTKQLLGKTYC